MKSPMATVAPTFAISLSLLLGASSVAAQQPPAPYPTPQPAPYPTPQPAPYPTPQPVPGAPQPGQPGQPGYPAAPTPAPPSAGGLQAPAPIDPAQADNKSDQEAQLDQSQEDDTGRGLTWFWIEAEGGFQHVGLETFEVDQSNLTAGFVPLEASGGYVGVGLGARLLFLTIGPRARVGFFENWQLYSIGGELGFRFQLGIVEPHFELGGGYAALGSFTDALGGIEGAADVSGGYGRISGGLDFLLASVLTLGVGASWEFMALTRPGLSLDQINAQPQAESLDDAQKQALALEGSGYGSAVSVGAKLGLQF